jgi:hypothetical protein
MMELQQMILQMMKCMLANQRAFREEMRMHRERMLAKQQAFMKELMRGHKRKPREDGGLATWTEILWTRHDDLPRSDIGLSVEFEGKSGQNGGHRFGGDFRSNGGHCGAAGTP